MISHHTDQSEKTTSLAPLRIKYRHPLNHITLSVPTSINNEKTRHCVTLFDSRRIIQAGFYKPLRNLCYSYCLVAFRFSPV